MFCRVAWMRRFNLVLFFVRKSWLIIITLGSPNWTCDRLHFSCIACSTHKHGGEKSWTKLLWHGKLFKVSRGKMNPRSFKDKFEEVWTLKKTFGDKMYPPCGVIFSCGFDLKLFLVLNFAPCDTFSMYAVLGMPYITKTDEFSEKFRGGGHFQSKNLYCKIWTFKQGFFSMKMI